MSVRLLRLALIAAALILPSAASAEAASIWTPVSSGTAQTISAIDYQSPSRLWYATTGGRIAYWNGSSFVAASGPTPGTQFTDIAFQPAPGTIGLAVANDGSVWRSTDAGVTWTQPASPMTPADCASPTLASVLELNAAVWADSATVFLVGDNGTVLKSTDSGATFHEMNKVATGTCADEGGSSTPADFTDAVFVAGNPSDGYLVDKSFGRVYYSSNGFVSAVRRTESTNSFNGNPRLALDPNDPSHLFVVDHTADGTGCSILCIEYSSDGGNTFGYPQYPQYTTGHPGGDYYDVSSKGGTEVTAGSGGEILTSTDGTHFYNKPADGALAAENWRSESAYDAAHAAVGGAGGAFVMTAAANTGPDTIAPSGYITGPSTVNAGSPATYTAHVTDNAGGSGINPASLTWTVSGFPPQHGATATYTFPRGVTHAVITLTFTDNAGNGNSATFSVTVKNGGGSSGPQPSKPTTTSTGSSTIIVYKVIPLRGPHGRYVPVTVQSKHPRKFVITILTKRGKHHVATAFVTLRHGGRKTVQVKLSSKTKAGEYYIVVRVFSLKNKGLGRQIKVAFILV